MSASLPDLPWLRPHAGVVRLKSYGGFRRARYQVSADTIERLTKTQVVLVSGRRFRHWHSDRFVEVGVDPYRSERLYPPEAPEVLDALAHNRVEGALTAASEALAEATRAVRGGEIDTRCRDDVVAALDALLAAQAEAEGGVP